MKPSKHYLIHVYEDSASLVYLRSVPNKAKTAKQARKIMNDEAYKDIVNGKYYFYNLLEQTTKTLEVYPSTQKTK